MSGANTSGYDLLVQFSKDAIDRGLARWIGTFPQTVQADIQLPLKDPLTGINLGNASYRATLALSLPTLVSVQPPGPGAGARVTLRSAFAEDSELSLLAGIFGISLDTGVNLKFAGSVDMQCDVALEDVAPPRAPAAGRSVVAKIDTATLTFSVTAGLSLHVGQTVVGNPITVDSNTLRNALGPVQTELDRLLNTVGSVPLTWPIPVPGPGLTKSTSVADLGFSAFQGSPEGLAIGVLSKCGPPAGNAAGLRTNPGNIGTTARLLIANSWLVCLVSDWLETVLMLPAPGFIGGGNTRSWNGSLGVTSPTGDTMTLTSLTVDVPAGGSGVRIKGMGFASGFCWTAAPDFTVSVRFPCDATGKVTPIIDPPVANSNVSIPWGCILAAVFIALVVGAIFGIISGIIAGIIEALVLSAQTMINPVSAATTALNAVFGLQIPLPVASLGIPCSLVTFDDLYVEGTPIYRDMVPARSSGSVLLPAGTSFNLDAGSAGGAGEDLTWTGSAIQALQGTHLALLYGGYDDVTYRQLQQINFPLATVAAGAIPAAPSGPLVFGARTSEGLYARCAVRRGAAGLELKWVTYARPEASLTVESHSTVTDSEEVDSGSTTCGWVEVEPGPSINQILEAGSIISGGGGGDPVPWNPYAGGGDIGFTPDPDGGIGSGFNLPTVKDLFADRRNRPTTSVTPHFSSMPWSEQEYAYRIVCRARPALITYPATYSWTVFGQQLPATSGTTNIGAATVTLDEDDPTAVIIETGLGGVVSGLVCCTAVDANGRQVTGCTTVQTQARYRLGGDCKQGRLGTFGGRSPANLLDLFVNGHELGAIAATSRAAARTLAAAVERVAPLPAEHPPASFREALLAATPPAKPRRSTRERRNR